MKVVGEPDFSKAILEHFGSGFKIIATEPLSGGSINEVSLLKLSNGEKLVVKQNRSKRKNLFLKETYGLDLLIKAVSFDKKNPLIIPKPHFVYESDVYRYLVLEYIPPRGYGKAPNWEDLGVGLALLHKASLHKESYSSNRYGLEDKNYLGDANQKNDFKSSWVEFFRINRLGFQMEWGKKNGYVSSKLENRLMKLNHKLEQILEEKPFPALVHGDLWSGNVMFDRHGGPVIFDPAVYYGDRETDIALTELFGRLDERFYQSYFSINQPSDNYEEKKLVYNLYHLLNHLNLFGWGYLSSVENTLARLV